MGTIDKFIKQNATMVFSSNSQHSGYKQAIRSAWMIMNDFEQGQGYGYEVDEAFAIFGQALGSDIKRVSLLFSQAMELDEPDQKQACAEYAINELKKICRKRGIPMER